MKRNILFVLFLLSLTCSAFAVNNTPVATPSYLPGIGTAVHGFALPVIITASSTTATNCFASLPNNDFTHVLFTVSSGTVYLVGPDTTSANAVASGVAITTTTAPIMIELPILAKDQGLLRIFGTAATAVVRMAPFKGKAAFLK
jgi:hypothetical protein